MDARSGLKECEPCAPNTLMPLEGQTQCVACPANGVDCRVQDRIQVLEGWFLGSDGSARALPNFPGRLARPNPRAKGNVAVASCVLALQVLVFCEARPPDLILELFGSMLDTFGSFWACLKPFFDCFKRFCGTCSLSLC